MIKIKKICLIGFGIFFLGLTSKSQEEKLREIKLFKEIIHPTQDSLGIHHQPTESEKWYKVSMKMEIIDTTYDIISINIQYNNNDDNTLNLIQQNFDVDVKGAYGNDKFYFRDRNILYFNLGEYLLPDVRLFSNITISGSANPTLHNYSAVENLINIK